MSVLSEDRLGLMMRATRAAVLPAHKAATSRRVMLLISAIVLMGLADLACTLIYMTTVGLPEANPIARWLAEFGSSRAVVAFKLLTMGLCCLCLYMGRTERRMEMCAWACTAILLTLSFHWIGFNRSITEHTNLIAYLADPNPCPRIAGVHLRGPDNWVRIED
ncbi:MAG: hypothetical protein J0L61_01170 [Planctomycetes bacterium]|nr:hypothetical protein [Planctomycetota bacterium]